MPLLGYFGEYMAKKKKRCTRTVNLNIREEMVCPLMDKYYDYMNAKNEIPGDMRKDLLEILNLLSAEVEAAKYGTNPKVEFENGDLEPLTGEDKSDFLMQFKLDLIKVLLFEEFSGIRRGMELHYIITISKIHLSIVADWIESL